MKNIAVFSFSLCLAAAPVAAQDEKSLMEQGAELFFRGLMTEMEPAIDELRGMADELGPIARQFADEMGPALGEMMQIIDDIGHYTAPEVLPNGDIIIRRKPDAPAFEMPESEIEI